MQILVINPGATSTKAAVFDRDKEQLKTTITHSAAELANFPHVASQREYRLGLILDWLKSTGKAPADFAAVAGRGGLLRHIESGVYEVTERVIYDALNPVYGEHASNLGVLLAKDIADMAGVKAYFADPVSVDELSDVARISGLNGMERESFFHALNHKSTARKAAAIMGRPYAELNLIVAHMGGGVSIAAHEHGRVTDVFNVKDDGSMGMDRGGSLPSNALVNLCFSGLTKAEVKRKIGSEAGVFSYLGTRDFREVESRAFAGDADAKLVFRALAYQHAKDIGAMAAVLRFNVDAVVFTGGIAASDSFVSEIEGYLGGKFKTIRIPGENEMQSLADGVLRVLEGEPAKIY